MAKSQPPINSQVGSSRNPNRKPSQQKLKERPNRHRLGSNVALAIIFPVILLSSPVSQAQSILTSSATNGLAKISKPETTDVWENGVGNGFKAGAQSLSLGLAAGYGEEILGSRQSHDLALASISYGYMMGSVKAEDHWYRGNWELRGELFSGSQFSPATEWIVGLSPHLRYNFATGTRWIPYVDIGAGVSATSIGPPDLSHYFEFNLQAATGVRWFVRDNVALGVEARYLHMSCAGLHTPNLGLNNVGGMFSISWFF